MLGERSQEGEDKQTRVSSGPGASEFKAGFSAGEGLQSTNLPCLTSAMWVVLTLQKVLPDLVTWGFTRETLGSFL